MWRGFVGAATIAPEDPEMKLLATKVLDSLKSFSIRNRCYFISGNYIKEDELTSAFLLYLKYHGIPPDLDLKPSICCNNIIGNNNLCGHLDGGVDRVLGLELGRSKFKSHLRHLLIV